MYRCFRYSNTEPSLNAIEGQCYIGTCYLHWRPFFSNCILLPRVFGAEFIARNAVLLTV